MNSAILHRIDDIDVKATDWHNGEYGCLTIVLTDSDGHKTEIVAYSNHTMTGDQFGRLLAARTKAARDNVQYAGRTKAAS